MARKTPPGFLPYIELQRKLPKGTPRAERARLARELKRQLASKGLTPTREPREHHEAHRRNPDHKTLWVLGGLAAVGLWLKGRQPDATPAPPAPPQQVNWDPNGIYPGNPNYPNGLGG